MTKLPPVKIDRLSAVATPDARVEASVNRFALAATHLAAAASKLAAPADIAAVLRLAGVRVPAAAVTSLQAGAAKGPMTVPEVDKLFAALVGLDRLQPETRIAAKSALARAGLLK